MKQDTIAIDQTTSFDRKTGVEKPAVAGSVAIILVAYALSICHLLFWEHMLSYVALPLIFIVAGFLHVYLIRKKVQFVSSKGEWICTLAATGLILVLFGSSALWIPNLPLSLIFSCASAFLLPFSLSEMWRTELQIAYEGVKIWYPTNEMLSKYPVFYFNSSPIRFRIVQGRGMTTATIKFKVSNEMNLGKIFYDLVQNKSQTSGKVIALTDVENKPFHWVFFTPDWLILNRTLDPEKTLAENGLKENDVIYAQKVSVKDIAMLKKYIR